MQGVYYYRTMDKVQNTSNPECMYHRQDPLEPEI
jgi:hypothetical protein